MGKIIGTNRLEFGLFSPVFKGFLCKTMDCKANDTKKTERIPRERYSWNDK